MPENNNPHQLSDDIRHLRIITKKELSVLVPYAPQYIAKLEKAKLFPSRIQLGQNRVGWRLIEIEDWINARPRGPVAAPQSANGCSGATDHRRRRIAP